MFSRTASLADRARPEEKAILARTVAVSGEGVGWESSKLVVVRLLSRESSVVGPFDDDDAFVPRMMVSPTMQLVSVVASSRYSRSSISIVSR